uniref:Acyl-CoA_dh_1 domain-containing protein n=1 Tax=Gongylonema pulchrum TaxID=637853 RepID=A0A183ETN2_9BILA
LCGLSIAQYYATDGIVGGEMNRLARISPVYGIVEEAEKRAVEYFGKLDNLDARGTASAQT